jgi:hypothetical protein
MGLPLIENKTTNSERTQSQITSLLLIVCLQYFLGTVFMKNTPVIELIWFLLLLLVVVAVRQKAIFAVSAIYLVFAVFYTTGIFFDDRGTATLAYFRTILVWCILSILVYGVLTQNTRAILRVRLKLFKVHRLHFAAIFLVAAWSFVALRDLNAGLVIDYRDFTGAGYLTLSDTFAMFSISYLCRDKLPSWEFAVVLGLSLLVIFLLGSRTTLAFYPFSVAFLIGKRVSLLGAFGWSVALLGGAYYWLKDSLDVESGAFFRVQTFFSTEVDESARVRDLFREDMLKYFNENPECFIVSCHPEQGHYDHSVLSVVQHFGFAGLVFLVGVIAVTALNFRFFKQQWFLPILVYCAISLVMSRAWLSVTFPVFLALILVPFLVRSKLAKTSQPIQNSRQILRRVEPESRN